MNRKGNKMEAKKVVGESTVYTLKRMQGDQILWIKVWFVTSWVASRNDRSVIHSYEVIKRTKDDIKKNYGIYRLTKEEAKSIKIVKITRTYKA